MKMIRWIWIVEIIALVAALYMYATGEIVKAIFWAVLLIAFATNKAQKGEEV